MGNGKAGSGRENGSSIRTSVGKKKRMRKPPRRFHFLILFLVTIGLALGVSEVMSHGKFKEQAADSASVSKQADNANGKHGPGRTPTASDKPQADKAADVKPTVTPSPKGESGSGKSAAVSSAEPTAKTGKETPVDANAKPTATPAAKDGKNNIESKPPKNTAYPQSDPNKKVALTFDDGPDSKYTPKILDILKENKVKATFFLVGKNAEKYPDIVKRIVKEGHTLGNHSWDHSKLTELTSEQISEEIAKTDRVLKSVTGHVPTLFRAPYGAVNKKVEADVAASGHKLASWSVDTRDWDGTSVAGIMEYVKKQTKPGGIVLQHSAGGKNSNLDNTVEALPELIDYLRQNGYTLVSAAELLSVNESMQ